MKRSVTLTIAFGICSLLAACGVRGDLQRPPPIFSDPPDEEAKLPVDAPVELALGPDKTADQAYYNALGGEIPKADPVDNVGEDGLEDVEPD